MNVARREQLLLTGVLIALGAGWGLTQPLTKIAVSTGHMPFGLLFWQLSIGAAFLGGVLAIRGRGFGFGLSGSGIFLVLALIGTIIPNAFSYRAAAHLPSGVMSIVIATVPMFAFPIALLLRLDRFSFRRLAGLILGLCGVALIALPEVGLPGRGSLIWILVALAAPLCYGLEGNTVARLGLAGRDPIQALFGASVFGAVIALPMALGTDQFIDPRSGLGLPELSLVLSALIHAAVYASYVWLVGRAGPVFAGQVAYMVTGFGVFWAMLILKESYASAVWIALILMLFGVSLVQPRRKDPLEPNSLTVDSLS